MGKSSQRNHTIELLRYVFSIIIVIFHIDKNILGSISIGDKVKLTPFSRGSVAVEFFFLLTGLLMAKSAYSKQTRCGASKDIGDETISFVWNKLKRILPCHIASFVVVTTCYIAVNAASVKNAIHLFVDSLPNLFLLQYTGIPCETPNNIEWYISAMFLCLLILYPLCRKYFSVFTKIIAPVVAILILGYFGYSDGKITGVSVWRILSYKGVLRSLAECALGASLFRVSLALSQRTFSRTARFWMTVVEMSCYIGVIAFTMSQLSRSYEFFALGALAVGITLTFSNITYSGKFAPTEVSNYLGKLSLPTYLFQLSGIYIAPTLFDSKIHAAAFAFAVSLLLPIVYLLISDGITKRLKS